MTGENNLGVTLEEMANSICSELCEYRKTAKNQEELDAACKACGVEGFRQRAIGIQKAISRYEKEKKQPPGRGKRKGAI